MSEPVIVSSLRKEVNARTATVRADFSNGGALGTTGSGFLTEYDEAVTEAKALAWDQAIETARSIINRRTGTYEADIDLLALENPFAVVTGRVRRAGASTASPGDGKR